MRCNAVHGIAEACLEIGFFPTLLIGRCGRLSARESSLSLYGPTPRPVLPDGDSVHRYSHFDPMHCPEILVHVAYL